MGLKYALFQGSRTDLDKEQNLCWRSSQVQIPPSLLHYRVNWCDLFCSAELEENVRFLNEEAPGSPWETGWLVKSTSTFI